MRVMLLRWLERREGRFLAAESVFEGGPTDLTKWLRRLWLRRLITVISSLKDVWFAIVITGIIAVAVFHQLGVWLLDFLQLFAALFF